MEEWAGWATCPARDALPGVGLKKRDQRVFAELAEIAFGEEKRDPSEVDDTDLPICPYAWTRPLHPFVCEYAFAPPVPPPESDELDANAMLERGNEDEDEVGMYRGRDLPELDTEEYMGRVNR